MASSSSTAYFTICSSNYLAYALTLRESLLAADPLASLKIYLVDEHRPPDLPEEVELISTEEVEIPDYWDMAFRYSVMEMNTAVKPFCVLDLFGKGWQRVVYLDPDIFVLRKLDEVEGALDAGAKLLLTPHSLFPLEDGMDPDDLRLLRTGSYNLGFAAFANTPECVTFLRWWARRLQTMCKVDLENGLFVDQKFMDLAPAYMPDCVILRHEGYNVAYWNLLHRTISRTNGRWMSNSSDLVFFHFSGVVPGDRSVLSKHQNRFGVDAIGEAAQLLEHYLSRLEENGQAGWSRLAYSYDHFSNGNHILPEVRAIYAAGTSKVRTKEEFRREPNEVLDALERSVRQERGVPISRLMWQIWQSRADLQAAFSSESPEGRRQFVQWYVDAGYREHSIAASHTNWVRSSFYQYSSLAKAPRWSGASKGYWARFFIRARPFYRGLPLPIRSLLRPLGIRLTMTKPTHVQPPPKAPRPLPAHLKPGVGIFGYYTAETGVGEGARRAHRALQQAGVSVSAHLVETSDLFSNTEDTTAARDTLNPHRISLFHVNADQFLHLPTMVRPENLRERYVVGYWAWELPEFPDEWRGAFELVDEIWVPSEFVRHAVAQKTDVPVIIVPHPIEAAPRQPSQRSKYGIPDNACVFLAIFDLNSYIERKNPRGVISAFKRAFPIGDKGDVRLIVKTHGSPSRFGKERAALETWIGGDPRIVLVDEVLDRQGLTQLQSDADVFVSLHRSEGFGLNIAECMALGKAVIVTAFSGSNDFAAGDATIGIGYHMVPVGSAYPLGTDQWWAAPDEDQAAEAMRAMALDPVRRAEYGRKAAERVAGLLSYDAVGKLAADRVRAIEETFSSGQTRTLTSQVVPSP